MIDSISILLFRRMCETRIPFTPLITPRTFYNSYILDQYYIHYITSITVLSRKISKRTPLIIHSQYFPLFTSQFDTSQFVNEIRFSSNPSGYSNQFFPHHSNANKIRIQFHYRFDNRWSCHRAKNRNRNLELGLPLANFRYHN